MTYDYDMHIYIKRKDKFKRLLSYKDIAKLQGLNPEEKKDLDKLRKRNERGTLPYKSHKIQGVFFEAYEKIHKEK